MRAEAITEDALLGGRVALRQPAFGYRAAIDPVLLAAAIPADPGETVLDVGTGVGAASLCLALRVANIRITGIEIQRELVRLAQENVSLNGLEDCVEVLLGEVQRPPPRLAPGSFDHVMANPPYFEAEKGQTSPEPAKAAANMEGEADLAAWLRCCLTMARPGGTVTVIHRADRLNELLTLLTAKAGAIVVFPLWAHDPFDNTASTKAGAKRVIVQARVGSRTPLRLAGGIILHHTDGRFTALAEAVLRHGAALLL